MATPEQIEAAVANGTATGGLSALRAYGKALFDDESGTAMQIWDESRANQAALVAKLDALTEALENLPAKITEALAPKA